MSFGGTVASCGRSAMSSRSGGAFGSADRRRGSSSCSSIEMTIGCSAVSASALGTFSVIPAHGNTLLLDDNDKDDDNYDNDASSADNGNKDGLEGTGAHPDEIDAELHKTQLYTAQNVGWQRSFRR